MKSADGIPVLDVGAIYGTDKNKHVQLAQQFLDAYSTAGFSYIVNHGVAEPLIERVFDASRQFHALPTSAKMAIELNHLHRGYIPIDTSTEVNSRLADVKHPNQSESFMVMREDHADSPMVRAGDYLAGPNQWPELKGFRETVMAYHAAMSDLAQRLVNIVALSLQADRDFIQFFNPPTTWLRLLYYPQQDCGDLEQLEANGVYGSAPHTDFGFLTLLAQDDIGGLQVLAGNDKWIDVPRLPGSFVMNSGDMLQRWSNGLLKSTPHRVINASGKERYSCPFFFDPNVKTLVEPLNSRVVQDYISAHRVSLYEPVRFDEFLKNELQSSYQHHRGNDC